jgi:hypothetical protein
MPQFIGGSPDDFYETYYRQTEGGKLESAILFYPAYYYSTVVRLYNFDGKAVTPEETRVISYQEKQSKEGVKFKKITSSKSFSTYEEAQDYISSQESGDWKIVGTDPSTSPVPLEEMEHYQLVHASAQKWQDKPAVKIFEYSK